MDTRTKSLISIISIIFLLSLFVVSGSSSPFPESEQGGIVWIETKFYSSPWNSIYDLKYKNLKTGQVKTIVSKTSPEAIIDASISGHLVVWVETKFYLSPWDSISYLKQKNLLTGKVKTLVTKTSPEDITGVDVSAPGFFPR